MITEKASIEISEVTFLLKLKGYIQLLKARLSLLVVFSGVIGYLLGNTSTINYSHLVLFCIAALLVTSSSNVINQILEKDLDKLMSRTMNRPIPTGLISVNEATIFAISTGILGIVLFMEFFNLKAALLSFISLLFYGFAYTPMKTRHPIAVFIGAIPGALPPMIGWVAVTNSFGLEPGILFAIQFIWQFPHFWAIAWVLDDDYRKAGIKLLPSSGGKNMNTAFQIMIYTLLLIPLGFMPYMLKMTGLNSALIALACGILFLAQTFFLMKDGSRKSALQIMFGSFFYLPIVQIAFVWDKL